MLHFEKNTGRGGTIGLKNERWSRAAAGKIDNDMSQSFSRLDKTNWERLEPSSWSNLQGRSMAFDCVGDRFL